MNVCVFDTNQNKQLFTPDQQTEQWVQGLRPSSKCAFHLLRRSRDQKDLEGQAQKGKSLMGPMSGAKNSGERHSLGVSPSVTHWECGN